MKNYNSTVLTALESPNGFIYCHCFLLDLVGGQLLLTDAAFDINHNSKLFISTNLVDEVDKVNQYQALKVSEYQLTFTNVDQTMLALFLANEQRGRRVYVDRVLLPNTVGNTSIGTLLSNRFIISSYMTNGDSLVVVLKALVATLLQPRGIVTTMESFKRFYPETTSCINSSNVKERFKWAYE